jgi:DNA repair protein RecO (recombination protein O)
MQEKTTGIVLHSIKYSDSATIVTIYTSQFGRVSYMVHGVNKKKSAFRSAFLQPLSIVELDVVHLPGKDLQRVKDVRIAYLFTGVPFNPIKNSLALFLSEVLFRTLRQTEPDESLFLFLDNSIQQLDCCETGLPNFHLVFLLKLSRYLGFEPNEDEESAIYFDLMNGVFTRNKPQHIHYLLQDATIDLKALLHADYSNMHELIYSRQNRLKLLESMIEYYRLHIPDFMGLHSLAVLQSLFD